MKHVILALALSLTASVAFAADDCRENISCEGLKFEWVPGDVFKVTSELADKTPDIDPLVVNVCAVRHFCPVSDVDGKTPDFSKAVKVPAGLEDTAANQRQLAAACQEAIDSQASNACYKEEVWQSQGGIYGSSAIGEEKKK